MLNQKIILKFCYFLGLRLIDPKSDLVQKVTTFFEYSYDKNKSFPDKLKAENLRVDTALAYDSGEFKIYLSFGKQRLLIQSLSFSITFDESSSAR